MCVCAFYSPTTHYLSYNKMYFQGKRAMEKVLFSQKMLCFKVMVFSHKILKIFKLVCLLPCFCQLDCSAEHGESFQRKVLNLAFFL